MGDYERAKYIYEQILEKDKKASSEVLVYLACCLFMLGMYKKAEEVAAKGAKCPLQVRIIFHVTHKMTDEDKLMHYHQQLQDVPQDQLCLASMHYMRNHYQEAIDIYKRYLLENRSFLALNVYIALCYYKLDYYDISQEVLAAYLESFPDSAIGINLKACNHYRLYNAKAAEVNHSANLEFESILL
jgi:intraflagellar transport protein 56